MLGRFGKIADDLGCKPGQLGRAVLQLFDAATALLVGGDELGQTATGELLEGGEPFTGIGAVDDQAFVAVGEHVMKADQVFLAGNELFTADFQIVSGVAHGELGLASASLILRAMSSVDRATSSALSPTSWMAPASLA